MHDGRSEIGETGYWITSSHPLPSSPPLPTGDVEAALAQAMSTMHGHIGVLRPLDGRVSYVAGRIYVYFEDMSMTHKAMNWQIVCLGLGAIQTYFSRYHDYRPVVFLIDDGRPYTGLLAKISVNFSVTSNPKITSTAGETA